MRRGVKFRAYPTKTQQNLIEQTFGCCRLTYNRGLAMRRDAYNAGEKIGYCQTSAMLTALKKEEKFSFLKDVDSIALQQSLRDLDSAYKNFFEKRARYPKFKSKHDNHQSYRTLNQGDNIRIEGNHLKLPKIGWLKIKVSIDVGRIHNVTVERTPTGKYFVVLNVEYENVLQYNGGGVVGLDVGLKEFYTDSNGNVVDNPKSYRKREKKLIREQRRLSRKQKGSKNRNKQRLRVAKQHEKVSNARKDFLHKETHKLAIENQVVCVEDLNVKGMLRNHHLAKAISDVSWSEFFRQLEYKVAEHGGVLVKVPTFYPSSQTCSCCGYKNPLVKNLTVREWDCPNCGTHHDRDANAAANILNKGLELLKEAA